MKYFVWLDQQVRGPFEEGEVCDMLEKGVIGRDTLLYCSNMSDCWFPAGQVLSPEPKPIQCATPSPAPTTSVTQEPESGTTQPMGDASSRITPPPLQLQPADLLVLAAKLPEAAWQPRASEPDPTPQTFGDFIGQGRVKQRLELALAAAKGRNEPLGHALLVGPCGSGRSTLATIVAKSMGSNIRSVNAAGIERAGDVAGLLTNLEERDVLFVDDIFRLRPVFEEYFYPALRDFQLDIIVDQGQNARAVRLNLPLFTLIGTTPSKQRLSQRLLSHFPIIESMDCYNADELTAIGRRYAGLLKLEIQAAAAETIARSCDGTPSDVLRRVRHLRDYAQVKGSPGHITHQMAECGLAMLSASDEQRESAEGRQGIPSGVRREVWRRDGGKCARCGAKENLEYDHIIPLSKGGSNTARNIELLCERCNRSKSNLIQ